VGKPIASCARRPADSSYLQEPTPWPGSLPCNSSISLQPFSTLAQVDVARLLIEWNRSLRLSYWWLQAFSKAACSRSRFPPWLLAVPASQA